MGFLVQGFYTQKFKVSNVIFRTLELTDGQGSGCSAGLSVADPLELAQSGGLPQEPLDEGPQVPGHQVYQTGEELHPVNINYLLSSLKQNIFPFSDTSMLKSSRHILYFYQVQEMLMSNNNLSHIW